MKYTVRFISMQNSFQSFILYSPPALPGEYKLCELTKFCIWFFGKWIQDIRIFDAYFRLQKTLHYMIVPILWIVIEQNRPCRVHHSRRAE